jgi:hypothetical protein
MRTARHHRFEVRRGDAVVRLLALALLLTSALSGCATGSDDKACSDLRRAQEFGAGTYAGENHPASLVGHWLYEARQDVESSNFKKALDRWAESRDRMFDFYTDESAKRAAIDTDVSAANAALGFCRNR